MVHWQRSLVLATVLGCAAAGLPARAQNAILASPPGSVALREARVAVSSGPTQSTMWFSAQLDGSADVVHVVVPVALGARVDVASDAWFEALADATETRVVPPSNPPDRLCEQARVPGPGAFDGVSETAHASTASPVESAAVVTLPELVVWAQGQGLVMSLGVLSALAELDLQGYLLARLSYRGSPGSVVTQAIRVSSPEPRMKIPLVLTGAGASPALLRVWAFGEGRVDPAQRSWSAVNPADVVWSLAGEDPVSTYRGEFERMLGESAWVVDASSHDMVFGSSAVGDGSWVVPSVIGGYLERAAEYGEVDGDQALCLERMAAMEASMARVGRACAPGVVANVGGYGCAEDGQPGETAAGQWRCGGTADDLALAMSGMRPGATWLTRWTGKLAPWTAWGEESYLAGGDVQIPVILECGAWDSSVCEGGSGEAGAGGSTGAGVGAGGSAWPPEVGEGEGSGTWSLAPAPGTHEDSFVDDDGWAALGVVLEATCWGDSSSSVTYDDYGGDDGCTGDSSSASSDTESCSGDSSSTSSSSDSETCSGSTERVDGSEETCSGSSDSESACSMGRPRGQRRTAVPLTAFGVLVAGMVLVVRRTRSADEKVNPMVW